jgi:hypothetical protein
MNSKMYISSNCRFSSPMSNAKKLNVGPNANFPKSMPVPTPIARRIMLLPSLSTSTSATNTTAAPKKRELPTLYVFKYLEVTARCGRAGAREASYEVKSMF